MKPVPETTFKGHSRSSAMDFLSDTGKIGYTYFQRKITEMILKVDQHWSHQDYMAGGARRACS